MCIYVIYWFIYLFIYLSCHKYIYIYMVALHANMILYWWCGFSVEDLHSISAQSVRSSGLSDLQCQMISSEAARFRHSLAADGESLTSRTKVRLSRCTLLDKTKQNKEIKEIQKMVECSHGKLKNQLLGNDLIWEQIHRKPTASCHQSQQDLSIFP